MIEIPAKQRKNEQYIVRFMTTPPSALYDIGVGPKTEWLVFRDLFPDLALCGVEANPEMARSIRDNGWSGKLLENAVYSSRGTMKFNTYMESGLDGSLLDIPKRPISSTFTVEAITLDDADREFGKLDNIVLWMDIEGAELTALQSGPELMASRRVKWINLEVRDNPPWVGGCSAGEVDEHLRGMGYVKVADYNHIHTTGHYDTIYRHESVEQNPKPTPNHVPSAR